jgi:hypothetical protein
MVLTHSNPGTGRTEFYQSMKLFEWEHRRIEDPYGKRVAGHTQLFVTA